MPALLTSSPIEPFLDAVMVAWLLLFGLDELRRDWLGDEAGG